MAPSILLFLVTLVNICNIALYTCNASSLPKFSSILIFGDSLLDTGNNNYIFTFAQANHPPYGVSFPGHPTGRFSDGKLMSDFLADALDLKKTVPPFLDPSLPLSDLPTGVCFASAGSGYDDNTVIYTGAISVTRQYTEFFKDYKQRLIGMMGESEAANTLERALVFVTSGGNDVHFNVYTSPIDKSMDQYQDFLIAQIKKFVKSLYKDGLRNMAIAGLPPVCKALGFGSLDPDCVNSRNSDPQVYNRKLQNKLIQLQSSLPGSRLVYADIFSSVKEIFNNPHAYGIYHTSGSCCTGLFNGPAIGPSCNIFMPPCPNPSNYLLWDSVHPTQAVYRHMSDYLINNALPQFNLTT